MEIIHEWQIETVAQLLNSVPSALSADRHTSLRVGHGEDRAVALRVQSHGAGRSESRHSAKHQWPLLSCVQFHHEGRVDQAHSVSEKLAWRGTHICLCLRLKCFSKNFKSVVMLSLNWLMRRGRSHRGIKVKWTKRDTVVGVSLRSGHQKKHSRSNEVIVCVREF